LLELAQQGGVEPVDLLWQPEWDDWRLADTVEGLFPVPRSDTEPVGDTPADEVSAEALFDEIPVDGFPAADTPIAGAPADETPAEETPVAVSTAAETTEAGTAAADAPPSRFGRVVVPESPGAFVLDRPARALIDLVRRVLPAATLDRIDGLMTTIGRIAYICAALLVTALLLIIGVRGRDATSIVIALAVLPVALMLGYSASRFLDAIRTRIDASPTTLGPSGFQDGLGATAFGLSVLTAAVGLAVTLAGAGVGPLVIGIGATLVLLYVAAAALDATTVNVSPRDEASPGEEAVAVLAFVAKLGLLRLVPMMFGLVATAVAVTMLLLVVAAFGERAISGFEAAWVGWRALAVALLPMAAWFSFLLVWLAIDVAGSLIGSGRDAVTGRDSV
jgi:hypothetical protein